jgi:hypothetical protein
MFLRHHRRVAGDVLAEVASEEARVEVIAATHAVGDVELDGLAFVEFSGRLREANRCRHQHKICGRGVTDE